MSQTVNDFRNFFNSDRIKKEFDLSDTLEKVIILCSSSIKKANINLINNVMSTKIFEVESELIQVLVNIINNAHDEFIKLNNTKNLLFINVSKKGNSIEISILDNANGIEENILPKIFESHFSTKKNLDGTGIGLYISKTIIEKNMKGYLTATNKTYTYNNELYKGALFKIKIPILS